MYWPRILMALSTSMTIKRIREDSPSQVNDNARKRWPLRYFLISESLSKCPTTAS